MAIETCLEVIFAKVSKLKPHVIVIDKDRTPYNVVSSVIVQDSESLIVANGERSQTCCHLLLCQFHAKKT